MKPLFIIAACLLVGCGPTAKLKRAQRLINSDCGEDFEAESNETICDDCCSNHIDDEDGDGTPDYYYCPGCNHSSATRPAWGGQCPKCMCHMEEGYF